MIKDITTSSHTCTLFFNTFFVYRHKTCIIWHQAHIISQTIKSNVILIFTSISSSSIHPGTGMTNSRFFCPVHRSASSWHPDTLDDLKHSRSTDHKQKQCHQSWANGRLFFRVFQCLGYVSSCSDVFAVFFASKPHSLFRSHRLFKSANLP